MAGPLCIAFRQCSLLLMPFGLCLSVDLGARAGTAKRISYIHFVAMLHKVLRS